MRLCTRCRKNEAESERKACTRCREREQRYAAAKRKRVASTGLCSRCVENPPMSGRRWCVSCAAYMQNAKDKHRSKPKPLGSCNRTDCTNSAEAGRRSCSSCRERERSYEQRCKDRIAWNGRQTRRRLRVLVFDAYGGAVCACCGEDRYEFLTIDHIAGNGAEHRRKNVKAKNDIYHWLKKEGFPPGFRVLCMNCNFSLGYHGYCPHRGWVQPTNNGRQDRPARQTAIG